MNKIRHTGIYVEDLEKMKEFYCGMFNLEIAVHEVEKSSYIDMILGLENTEIEIYKLKAKDGGMVELLHRKGAELSENREQPVWNIGRIHVAFTVEHVDMIWEELSETGYDCISKPCVSPDGNAKVCFARDPEGNYLELVQELNKGKG